MNHTVGLVFIILFGLFHYCLSFEITVNAQDEECFFEKLQNGSQLALTYEVTEGGALDIDIKVTDPAGIVIIDKEKERFGKFVFRAALEGEYVYCFVNQMSTLTPKGVMFQSYVREYKKPEETTTIESIIGEITTADADDPKKIAEMLSQLSTILVNIKVDQAFMEVRDKIHSRINESTNSRVVMWSFFEVIVVITMTVCQVYYLKRFFEVRRIV